MPRRLRHKKPGGVYHVTNRGVDRCDIVRDDIDRKEWFRLFQRVALRCRWQVFAHVLMTNHFHLFLRTPEANLSAGMHDCQSGYATLFNTRHSRTGTLFQGRFHPVPVESEGHSWVLSRYIHLNPCRAGLAARPEDYRWSTYRFYLDPSNSPPWLDWRTVLAEFSGSEGAARIAYRRFVDVGLTETIPDPLVDGTIEPQDEVAPDDRSLLVPSQHFASSVVVTADRLKSLASRLFCVDEFELNRSGRHSNLARDAAIWAWRHASHTPLMEIASAFQVRSSTISDTVRRCEERQRFDAAYRALCLQLAHELRQV